MGSVVPEVAAGDPARPDADWSHLLAPFRLRLSLVFHRFSARRFGHDEELVPSLLEVRQDECITRLEQRVVPLEEHRQSMGLLLRVAGWLFFALTSISAIGAGIRELWRLRHG